jgi:hypothetical protein
MESYVPYSDHSTFDPERYADVTVVLTTSASVQAKLVATLPFGVVVLRKIDGCWIESIMPSHSIWRIDVKRPVSVS